MTEYIDIRIDQLKEDLEKASNPDDRAWYNRLIQELSWAKNQNHNCYMGTDAKSDWFQEQTN
jgi:DnaJ-domain-containing protein 1